MKKNDFPEMQGTKTCIQARSMPFYDLAEPLKSSLPTRIYYSAKRAPGAKKTLLSKGTWVVEAPGPPPLKINASR